MVRCELDGVMNYKGQEQLLLIKALNEFDPKFSGKQPPCACKPEATIDRKRSPPRNESMSIENVTKRQKSHGERDEETILGRVSYCGGWHDRCRLIPWACV